MNTASRMESTGGFYRATQPMETNASYSYTACAGVLQDCMQAAAAPSITGLKQEGSIH